MSVTQEKFFTMDTVAELTIITKKPELGEEVVENIKEICYEIENRISTTIETSDIYKFNYSLRIFESIAMNVPIETLRLLKTAQYMKEQTNGAFDPCLGYIIDLWGFKNQGENVIHKLPEKDEFYPAVDMIKYFDYEIFEGNSDINFLMRTGRMCKFDLGAIGKGYATDKISDYLVEAGISHALVSFTSSILAVGKSKDGSLWTIGLTDPLNTNEICGYLNVTNKFVAVSGGYERFIIINGKDYCHIIDPETGYPVDNDLLCVVVVMNAQSALKPNEDYKNNGAISDALSTALYVMGKQKALDFYMNSPLDFEMILFVKDDSPRGYDIIPTNVMFSEIKNNKTK